ncbi:MAG: hypothetical protein ACYCXW_15760, partial [Solirubrobacteraceae bacterium]
MRPAAQPGAPRERRSHRWLVRAALLASTLAVCGVAWAEADPGGPAAARTSVAAPLSAQVSIAADAATAPIPRSFLGLSTEYWSLPMWSGEMPLLERVVALLRVPGGGPFVLRVGGDSADHVFWDPSGARMPEWA